MGFKCGVISAVVAVCLFGCDAPQTETTSPSSNGATSDESSSANGGTSVTETVTPANNITALNRSIVEKFFDVGFTQFDPEATRPLLTESYYQHNPMIPHGAESLLQLLPVLKQNGLVINNHRMIADEQYVVTHNLTEGVQQLLGHEAVVTFDIWRMENGKMAEHWDNVQARVAANPSGRTQVDGVKTITDLDKTQSNKDRALEFVNSVLIPGSFDQANAYMATDLIQHGVDIADGLDAYVTAYQDRATKYSRVHMVVAEGNFVFVMLEGSRDGEPVALHELFRLHDGEIVERWDVIEEIPAEWPEGMQKF